MGTCYQGRHKGDVAIDNAMREARNANYKDRRGINDKTIIDECMSQNKKKIKYSERKTDPDLTAFIARGYNPKKDAESASRKRLAEKKKEAELLDLSNETGVPVEILRKNPNLKPLNWEDMQTDAETEEVGITDKVELKIDEDVEEETTEDNLEA